MKRQSKPDLPAILMHPVRIRILNAFSHGRRLTTAALCQALSDSSPATVYRHVAALQKAGVLRLAGEKKIRGTVERTYELDTVKAYIGNEEAKNMSREDHRLAFTSALGSLIAEFNSYIDRRSSNPSADLVGYRQLVLWADRRELEALIGAISKIIVAAGKHEERKGRRRILVSPIFFPLGKRPSETGGGRKPSD